MKTTIYNKTGKEAGTLDLPKDIFEAKWNPDLVHQVSIAMDSNARTPIAHTKNRGDVRGGGKKPWRQKGTGQARHGSRRSPIWKGGGVTFGPINQRDYTTKINKKMRTKALFSLLSYKAKAGTILFVDSINLYTPKTSEAKNIINKLATIKGFEKLETKKKNAALFAFGTKNEVLDKSFRNISNISIDEMRNLNVSDILRYKYLIVTEPENTISFLKSKISKENKTVKKNKK